MSELPSPPEQQQKKHAPRSKKKINTTPAQTAKNQTTPLKHQKRKYALAQTAKNETHRPNSKNRTRPNSKKASEWSDEEGGGVLLFGRGACFFLCCSGGACFIFFLFAQGRGPRPNSEKSNTRPNSKEMKHAKNPNNKKDQTTKKKHSYCRLAQSDLASERLLLETQHFVVSDTFLQDPTSTVKACKPLWTRQEAS